MTADKLIKSCASPVDTLIVEFENGTSEEYNLWNTEECTKSMRYRYKKIDAFDMYDTGHGKVLQVLVIRERR